MGHFQKMRRRSHVKQARGPLRRIVEVRHRSEWLAPMERLECDHWQPARQDLVGVTNAEKRRCSACHSGRVLWGPEGQLPSTPRPEEEKV